MADRGVGRPPYWVVQRLIVSVAHQWPQFHGHCLLHGLDPLRLPLDAFCNLAYAWLVDGADRKERERFDYQLTVPPASARLDERGEWSDDATSAAFLQAMVHLGSVRAGAPVTSAVPADPATR
jgi:hypothetical protein